MKILNRSGVYIQGEWQKYTPLSPLLYKDKRLGEMNIGDLILVVNSVTVSCLIYYDSLLQNTTDIITKCDSYFITKCHRSLLKNAPSFLLQNAIIFLQNTSYYKMPRFYYKMRQLLQNATFIINCDSTACNSLSKPCVPPLMALR